MAEFDRLPSPSQTYDRKMMMQKDAKTRAVQDWLKFTKPRKPVA